jgi:hypothetical protein
MRLSRANVGGGLRLHGVARRTFNGSKELCVVVNFDAVTKILLQLAILSAMAIPMSGQGLPRPNVPEKIQAPDGNILVLQVHASGSQIYVCQAGTNGQLAWTLKAPEAELRDQQGAVIGRHYAGPSWKLSDGSEVSGKPVGKVDSPDPNSIPWLLVSVSTHAGNGVLSPVTYIQRINTKGGAAPPASTCSGEKQNTEVKSSYTADYYFYAPAK